MGIILKIEGFYCKFFLQITDLMEGNDIVRMFEAVKAEDVQDPNAPIERSGQEDFTMGETIFINQKPEFAQDALLTLPGMVQLPSSGKYNQSSLGVKYRVAVRAGVSIHLDLSKDACKYPAAKQFHV